MHWKHGALTTGLPGNPEASFSFFLFFFRLLFLNRWTMEVELVLILKLGFTLQGPVCLFKVQILGSHPWRSCFHGYSCGPGVVILLAESEF